MIKIMVLSDTHMPKFSKQLPNEVLQMINKVECIIHAGDFCSKEAYDEISKHKNIYGVYGNVDSDELKQILPKKKNC